MSGPTFSVIIPTFNRPKHLRRAIDSVLAQTYSKFEVIIVDDGSLPAAEHYIGDVLVTYGIRYYRQENGGPSKARETGLNAANGSYLCFLDDDDEFLPHHLETLADAIVRECGKPMLYKTGTIRRASGKEDVLCKLYENDKSILEQHWVQGDSLLSYAIPRPLAKMELPSHLHAEDFNWIGRLMLQVPTVQLQAYTVIYHWHQENRTASNPDKSVLSDRMRAVADLYQSGDMSRRVSRNFFRQNMAHQGLHWVRQCLRDGSYLLAWWGIAKTIPYLGWKSRADVAYTVLVFFRSLV